jgi:myo-inositol-1(or 4)-monophosphatase
MADAHTGPDGIPVLSEDTLSALERMAVELARLSAAEIATALGRTLAVRYKGADPDEVAPRDPVSEVDHKVEVLVRARLAERFPEHDIIGEEIDERHGRGHDIAWVIDPIDGTANFVNGFPLFAASIGVLHRGRPVAGAVWCSTSHALRAGIYHGRPGGALRFEDEPLEIRRNLAVRRHLAGEPEATADAGLPWDVRKTGSAAIECAFVAAGFLRVARFERPNVWDVGGGIALVRAAGGEARTRGARGWEPLERFGTGPEGETQDLQTWRQPVIIGDPDAVERLCRAHP